MLELNGLIELLLRLDAVEWRCLRRLQHLGRMTVRAWECTQCGRDRGRARAVLESLLDRGWVVRTSDGWLELGAGAAYDKDSRPGYAWAGDDGP